MKVYILDKTLEYENDKNAFDAMVSDITDLVGSSNAVFSHLVIDGVEVYEDFYDYFIDNLKNIQQVIVVVKSEKKISEEVIVSTMDYIERAIPEIEILSNEFYKSPYDESWNKLNDLIEGFKWIMDTFVAIDSNNQLKDIVSSYEQWNLYAKDIYTLKELLVEFEQILENNDYVSIGDILSYEIIPLFKEMYEKLGSLLQEEVAIDDIDR